MPAPAFLARRLGRGLLTVLVVWFVASLTLHSAVRYTGDEPSPFFCLLGCGNQGLRDLLSNILLFVPLGWVVAYWARPRTAFLVCLAATIAIETTQAFALTGRDPSLRDILTNAAGGALGIWLLHSWSTVLYPAARAGLRYGSLALLGWLGVLTFTGLGGTPAPTSRGWYGQYAADLGKYDRYEGQVLSVKVAGWSPPPTRMDEPNPLRRAITRGAMDITVVVVSGPRPTRSAPMFGVHDGAQEEQLFVGQHKRDLQFQIRTRFDAWDLRGLSMPCLFSPAVSRGTP